MKSKLTVCKNFLEFTQKVKKANKKRVLCFYCEEDLEFSLHYSVGKEIYRVDIEVESLREVKTKKEVLKSMGLRIFTGEIGNYTDRSFIVTRYIASLISEDGTIFEWLNHIKESSINEAWYARRKNAIVIDAKGEDDSLVLLVENVTEAQIKKILEKIKELSPIDKTNEVEWALNTFTV